MGRSWNTLALNVLEICVVVEVSDREDARGFDSGRFALLEDLFPPVVSGQQRSTQGAWALTADVFVHHSAIDMGGYRTLTENQKVEYTVSQGPKGPQADQVHSA